MPASQPRQAHFVGKNTTLSKRAFACRAKKVRSKVIRYIEAQSLTSLNILPSSRSNFCRQPADVFYICGASTTDFQYTQHGISGYTLWYSCLP